MEEPADILRVALSRVWGAGREHAGSPFTQPASAFVSVPLGVPTGISPMGVLMPFRYLIQCPEPAPYSWASRSCHCAGDMTHLLPPSVPSTAP